MPGCGSGMRSGMGTAVVEAEMGTQSSDAGPRVAGRWHTVVAERTTAVGSGEGRRETDQTTVAGDTAVVTVTTKRMCCRMMRQHSRHALAAAAVAADHDYGQREEINQ